jgi:O-antigen/teichoic acid export membrane protein
LSSQAYSGDALRRGAWHYLTGRAITAILTLTIQLSLVRLLVVDEYGQYVTLLAGFEIAIVLAAAGLNWGVTRFVPEYRIKASYDQARRFISRLLRYRMSGVGASAVLWLLLSPLLLPDVGGANPWLARGLIAGLIVVEGLSLFVRDNLLGALLLQRTARAANISRQLAWAVLIGVIAVGGHGNLVAVLITELVASAVGLAVGWRGLRNGLLREMAGQQARDGWAEPTRRDLWETCSRIYGSDLLGLVVSTQVLAVMTQRLAGNDAAALFGFIRVLLTQLSRYMPASLLYSLIQPKLAASFVDGGGMPALSRNANLINKISLLALMPVVIAVAIGGEHVLSFLSGHRFDHTGGLLFVAMLQLIPSGQGLLLMTVTVVSGHARYSPMALGVSLVALPIAYAGLKAGLGVWAPLAAQMVSNVLIVGTLIVLLSRGAGYSYRNSGLHKTTIAAASALLPAIALQQLVSLQPIGMVVMVAASVTLFGAVFLFVGGLPREERLMINQVLGRRIIPV